MKKSPKCSRKVKQDKYERNAPEIRNWWYQLFDILEFDAAITPDKRFKVVREVLPNNVLKRVLSILSFQNPKYKPEPSVGSSSSEDGIVLDVYQKPGVESDASLDTRRTRFDYDELLLNAKALNTPSTPSTVVRERTPRSDDKLIPYMNFFKRRPDRAAIWRALPPPRLQDMTLIQKAEALTEAIATDFVAWIKTLSGDEESNLTVNAIMEMFEIATQINSATSLCVKLKEMPSVTHSVAEAMNRPEMAKREMLFREIMRDHAAERRPRKIIAFGRRLPSEMQVKPLKENVKKKWLSCDKVPQRLETMAAVWQGITHLNSTMAYCSYLHNERPEITPPAYLVETGLLETAEFVLAVDMDKLKNDSFGDVSRVVSWVTK